MAIVEYNKPINDLCVGNLVEGYYVIKNISVRVSTTGKPYLSAKLSDCTGETDAVMWDYNGSLSGEDNGSIVSVRGNVNEYKGATQFTLQRLRLAGDNDKYDLSTLVPTTPMDIEGGIEELRDAAQSIEDEDYRKIAQKLLEDNIEIYRTIPAAKSVHHAFRGGLMMHTVNMLRCADFLAGLYSEVIDRSLLMAGALLHDIGKSREFSFSQLGLVTDYSKEGNLLGHLYIGAQMIAEAAKELGTPDEKSLLLQHMLLSHHGTPEMGAAVTPKCAESELLHIIDSLDSRMEIYAETFLTTPEGTFSKRVPSMEKILYNHG